MFSVLEIALTCLLVFKVANIAADDICVPVTAEYGIVCVCNATYCDTAGSVPQLEDGEYVIIATTKSGQRFNVTKGNTIKSYIPHNIVDPLVSSMTTSLRSFPNSTYITIDPRITLQTMEGFGGAFTDTAGMNILNISSDAQEYLLRSYYGTDGLDYNMGRVPIAGCDYSPRAYAYNEYPVNDTYLSNFTLTEEDYTFKIPLIKRAQALATDEIHLHGALWSPPPWMKTNNAFTGYSQLLPEYYFTYALYHLKFLQEYNKENVTIYALSTGNQPIIDTLGDIINTSGLGWVTSEQAQWVIDHFGPTIKDSEFNNTKIYIMDEQTPFVNDMLPILIEDEAILKYVDGVALHYYVDKYSGVADIEVVYDLLGNISIINTEASAGATPDDLGIKLGSWARAEEYLYYVIAKIQHHVSGWIDWNLAVNMEGGPAWNNNTIDAFIVVDAENDQFFKTPMYYAFGHVSKHVPRGSERIATNTINGVPNVAFKRPDGLISLVSLNNGTADKIVTIDDRSTGQLIKYTMEAHSMTTIVYKPKSFI